MTSPSSDKVQFTLEKNVSIKDGAYMCPIIEALLLRDFGKRCEVKATEGKIGTIFTVYHIGESGGVRKRSPQKDIDYLYVRKEEHKNISSLIDDKIIGYELVSSDPLMWYLFSPSDVDSSSSETRFIGSTMRGLQPSLTTTVTSLGAKPTDLIEWRGFALRTLRRRTEETLDEAGGFIGPILSLRRSGIFSFTVNNKGQTDEKYVEKVIEVADAWEIKYLGRYSNYLYFSKPKSKVIHFAPRVWGEQFLRDAVMRSYMGIDPAVRVFNRKNRDMYTVTAPSLQSCLDKVSSASSEGSKEKSQ